MNGRLSLNEAQCLVLSSAFHGGPDVWRDIPTDTLSDPYRGWGEAIQAIAARGDVVDVGTFTSECLRRGINPDLSRWMHGPVPAETAVRAFLDAYAAEQIEASLIRAKADYDRGVSHWQVMDDLIAQTHHLHRPITEEATPWWTWDEVLAMSGTEQEWVLPGLLAHGERLVFTGAEGHGKSTLIYQLAIGAGYGVSPLSTDVLFRGQRVLILDVENWHETQVRAQYVMMRNAYRRVVPDFTPAVALMKARLIDLLTPSHRRALISACDRYQPDMLVMGSGYKLVEPASDYRTEAIAIQRTADEVRARTGCAIVIETHAGHGNLGDRNGWRPDGSSYWLRWPEFGIGLSPVETRHGRLLEAKRWRGDRATDREWPAGWRSGSVMPWIGLDSAEMEYAIAHAS